VVPEIVPVRSGAVNVTEKRVRRWPEPGLTLIRALLALIVLPGADGLVVDWVELVCGAELEDPGLEAAEQAGNAAIPSTTSEATTFGLIPGESTLAHGILTLDTFSFSQGD
jgi:hypothetical protein